MLLRTGSNSYVRIVFVDPAETWTDHGSGEYSCRDDEPIPTIKISRDLSGVSLLDAIIHECTHHLLPFLAEESVSEFGSNLSRVLHQLGYRVDADVLRQRSVAKWRRRS